MEKGTGNMRTFDMDALKTNLPQNRRGLSRYYSGKARSFACIMAEVRCLEDLKKQEHAKKRKKHSDRQQNLQVPPLSCRRVASSTQCASPIVGV